MIDLQVFWAEMVEQKDTITRLELLRNIELLESDLGSFKRLLHKHRNIGYSDRLNDIIDGYIETVDLVERIFDDFWT